MKWKRASLFSLVVLAPSFTTAVWADTGSIQGEVPLPARRATLIPMRPPEKIALPPPPLAGVWLEGPLLRAPDNPPQVSVVAENHQFGVSLVIVPLGTRVAFLNKDNDFHIVYSLSRAKRFSLERHKKGRIPAPTVLFDKAGFVDLRCEIHDWMKANIIVVDSPHVATTDAKGRFTLEKIPAGRYTLHAQFDSKIAWQMPVQVQSKQTTLIVFPPK